MSGINLASTNGVRGENPRRHRFPKHQPGRARPHNRLAATTSATAPIRELCALMANRLRQRVLIALATGPMEVTHLAQHLETGISGLSQNLKRLSIAGLVSVDQVGRSRIYRLGPGTTVKRRGTKVHLDLTARDGSKLSIVLNAEKAPRPPRKT